MIYGCTTWKFIKKAWHRNGTMVTMLFCVYTREILIYFSVVQKNCVLIVKTKYISLIEENKNSEAKIILYSYLADI